MITASQFRAARALTAMTIDALALESGLAVSAIEDAERMDVHPDPASLERLRTVLETKGVIFIAAGEGDAHAGPGVRLRHAVREEGIRPQNLNAANDD